MNPKSWLALMGLTLSTFIFNTSEFIPIGLLTSIAADFQVTETTAGMLISVYAWVVMLLSLPLMILVSKMEMKKLMLIVIAVFGVFQFLSSISTNYYMLMLSRMGVACAHSIFWSIVSPLACRIVPERYKSIALSMIVTGSSIAAIIGMPLGRIIGLHAGWRMTFSCISFFCLVLFFYLFSTMPTVPSRGKFSLGKLPTLIHNKLLMQFFLLTAGLATAHFICYAYIEPFFQQVVKLTPSQITVTLTVFGGAGLLGSVLFSKFYDKNPARFISASLLTMALCLLLLTPVASIVPFVVVTCILWGISGTCFNVSFQSEIISIAPKEATAVAMSIFSGIFNLGIGSGTYIGGVVFKHTTVGNVAYVAGALVLTTFLYWYFRVRKHNKFGKEIPKRNNQ